jgi:hypothetical protein
MPIIDALIVIATGHAADLPSTAEGIAAALNVPVGDIQPGIQFFCKDTGNLYVWNGVSMVEIGASAGFQNPMLDSGDMLYEDPSLSPARLPIGTSGEVLTVVNGLPAWAATAQSTNFEANGSTLSSDSTINFEGDGTYITISNPSAGNVKSALNYSALITALEASLDTTFDAYGAAASALSAAESFASSAAATAQSNAESYAASAASTAQSNAETYANSVNTTGSSGSCTGNAATATSATTAANLSGSQTANYFYAAPNGSAGAGSWRAIVAADIPTLNQNTSGSSGSCTGNAATATAATTAGNLSGTPALPNGTSATTQSVGDNTTKVATDAFVNAAVAVEAARAETEEALLASIISGLGSEFLALTGGTMSGTINMNENLIVWENSSLGSDTSLSRVGPGILGIGTGANGSTNGTLDVGALNVSGASTFGGSGTTSITTQAPGTSPATAGFDLWQNTTPTVTGAATTVALSTTTAPVSLGSNTWRYTLAAAETGAASNGWLNALVVFSGWTGGATGNNGTFTITASTSTTITVVNATGSTTNTGTPVAISSAVVNSPILQLAGTVNTGTAGALASVPDVWSVQNIIGSVGPNPTSTLTFTHTGSSGTAAVSVPQLNVTTINGAGNLIINSASGEVLFEIGSTVEFLIQGAVFRGGSASIMGFTSTAAPNGASADTGISRISPGIVGIGTGTSGNTAGTLAFTTALMTASAAAPTSAGTAGTAGQIIYYNGLLYFCSVTGAAGSATWNKLSMTSV